MQTTRRTTEETQSKGNNIFRLLKQCMGYSLAELQDLTGISAVYLNELERGKKSAHPWRSFEKLQRYMD